jgi:hypothetical protein
MGGEDDSPTGTILFNTLMNALFLLIQKVILPLNMGYKSILGYKYEIHCTRLSS